MNTPLDFQKATANHVLDAFRQGKRRVLVADEAGLGKTTVASEVVRQVRDLDGIFEDDIYCIVYVCCNHRCASLRRAYYGSHSYHTATDNHHNINVGYLCARYGMESHAHRFYQSASTCVQ